MLDRAGVSAATVLNKPFPLTTPVVRLYRRPPDNVQAVFREQESCARVGLCNFPADCFTSKTLLSSCALAVSTTW